LARHIQISGGPAFVDYWDWVLASEVKKCFASQAAEFAASPSRR
jgi:hypothetical protein